MTSRVSVHSLVAGGRLMFLPNMLKGDFFFLFKNILSCLSVVEKQEGKTVTVSLFCIFLFLEII